jgi:hypothetical protein
MPIEKIGYKVLISHSHQLKSAWLCGSDSMRRKILSHGSRAITRYIKNKWSNRKANYGPLCVFDGKFAAIQWINELNEFGVYSKDIRLYKCKYIESNESGVWALDSENNHLMKLHRHNLPPSTRFANQVMITERIKDVHIR